MAFGLGRFLDILFMPLMAYLSDTKKLPRFVMKLFMSNGGEVENSFLGKGKRMGFVLLGSTVYLV